MAASASGTKEYNFETNVETFLEQAGWKTFAKEREAGVPKAGQHDYDRQLALKTDSLINFIKETQADEWAKIEKLYGAKTEAKFLERVKSVLEPHKDQDGLLANLRNGFKMAPGASFKLCYFKPSSDKNETLLAKYRANNFEVVRQLNYGTMADNANDSIDVVLFLNGIPVVTMELKNNLTGQCTAHAVKQYKRDRNPKELIFKPNRRSLVHFAVDSETAEMTTWLRGPKTYFMPFNMGNGFAGAGNPANPGGYRTEYLYRKVLAPDSLLDIIQRFIRIEYDNETKCMKKVIFPRYHQLDAVRLLAQSAKSIGTGKNYLIQHSAGSGKSNSIAWLAHRLSTLHDANDKAVFDSVVILTDRKNLDSQLSTIVDSVEHKRGVVKRIEESDGSSGLRDALNEGAKIITSTIQKFPYICGQTKLIDKKFAVIIDEAHSSQTGKAHAKMKAVLSGYESDDEFDAQDEIVAEMQSQGVLPNLSIFAFTATPKAATLEVFGERGGDEKPKPFHLYSMKQAIEEGYILDVLENYTCYATYFKLAKTITSDPRYKEAKAKRALTDIVRRDYHLMATRVEIIVEHFIENVAGDLQGNAKAMVVTSSRATALSYYKAMKAYIERKGYNIGLLVAFSGTLQDGDTEWTEAKINGFAESQTASEFDTDKYQIMVAANKYQTGFDQPKLEAMYVDKKLTGVAAVQTLSRLNRCYPGKRTYIVDFVNTWEDIKASFDNYYEVTELDRVTDLNVVYDIKAKLDTYQIYSDREVELVSDAWYSNDNENTKLLTIEGLLSPAVDKWKDLDLDSAKNFKKLLKSFLRKYSFITQMIPLGDEDLHRFNCYAACLIKKLFIEDSSQIDLRKEVTLEYLRVENKGTKSITLEQTPLRNGGGVGGSGQDEDEFLSKLVEEMNEKFGTDWQDADKIIKACADKIMEDDEFVAQARHNSMEDLKAVFGQIMMEALASILVEGSDMANAWSSNPEGYNKFMNDNLLPYVYRRCNEDEEESK